MPLSDSNAVIVSGSSNPALSAAIALHLGQPLAISTVLNFADGETFCRVLDSVSGKDVYLV